MKAYSRIIEVRTWGPMQLFSLRDYIDSAIAESNVCIGILWISVEGATPALVVLERGREREFIEMLVKIIPFAGWRHGNAYAHLISTTLSTSLALPIDRSRVLLDKEYDVYLLETRSVHNHIRRVFIEIHGETTC